MTPTPPSSSDGSSLPPRHRPNLGNLAKDTTELDLWAFEDDLDLPEEQDKPEDGPAAESPKSAGKAIPAPREKPGGKSSREADSRPIPKTPTGGDERIRMNIHKPRSTNQASGTASGQSKPESEFEDLENWEDAPVEPEFGDLPGDAVFKTDVPAVESKARTTGIPVDEPETVPMSLETQVPAVQDEFSPAPVAGGKPISLVPRLGLTKVERIGLIFLLVIMLAGAIGILVFSLNRLPTETGGGHENDYPIKGGYLTVEAAATYWRVPITGGPTPDTVRRDTQLLPVLEIKVSGGPAALRVLFRNDEKTVIGDAVTRAVPGPGTLQIPATAGFDDLGMHAAYRTGESTPWTIEVYEAPSKDTAGKDFKKLFETTITTDRR